MAKACPRTAAASARGASLRVALFGVLSLTGAAALGQDALVADAAAALASDAASVDAAAAVADLSLTVHNLWMLVATVLVFSMHLGFATVESGLTRAKNTTNILFKNVAIVGLGLLSYALVGFNLMYPGGAWSIAGWLAPIGPGLFGVKDALNAYDPAYNASYTYWTDFIYQGMFAATAATIVSGAVAERVKLMPFLLFSLLFVSIVYPVCGSWKWGLGWLDGLGFHDFAGSTLVHSVGGWGALAGVMVLGPRLGKYVQNAHGKSVVRPIMGHSMPLATIGVLVLWLGWFGFNGGSVLSADPAKVSFVFVTTAMGGAAGLFTAMLASKIIQKKPDLSMILNGILAGLVAITAGADVITVSESILIGGIAGFLVVGSVVLLDRLRLDDPVGAVSVHLVCGVWGTLAAGLFGEGKSVTAQLVGIGAVAAASFLSALVIFLTLKHTMGLRVSREEELMGLDVGEHGMEAYSGFQFFTTQ